jgi:small subunit ribosomal protein S17
MSGLVVSHKCDKTAIVKIDTVRKHSKLEKRIKISTRFKAHDEKNECKIGDIVEIEESRPLSSTKKWNVRQILKKGAGEAIELKDELEELKPKLNQEK